MDDVAGVPELEDETTEVTVLYRELKQDRAKTRRSLSGLTLIAEDVQKIIREARSKRIRKTLVPSRPVPAVSPKG